MGGRSREALSAAGQGAAKRPESDIDVLYERPPGARLGWNIETLADELSQLLGRRVDLISRNALHARLRDRVLAEALLLYVV